MRCKGCGYRLWTLKPGECPECGRRFIPSEHAFVPGRVRFQCPHCLQSYAGTDEHGLPRPREFACATCQYPVRVDEMICVPAEGADPDSCNADEHPWVRRAEVGWWKSLWRTVTGGMTRPRLLAAMLAPITPQEAHELGAAEPPPPDARAASRFAQSILMLVALANFVPFLAFAVPMSVSFGNPLALTSSLLLPPLAIALFAFIALRLSALITHGVLRLGGPLPFKLRGTTAAVLYGYAPAAIMVVPCLGPYCLGFPAMVWVCVSSIGQLSRIQRVSTWRAAVAVVLGNVLLLGVPFAFAFGSVLVLPAMAARGTFPAPVLAPPVVAPAPASDPNAQPLPGAESPEEEQPADDQLGAQPEPDA